MKKFIISSLIILGLFITPVMSLEWGGSVNSSVKGTSQDFTSIPIELSETAVLWLNNAFTEDSKWYLSTELAYKFKAGFYGEDIGNLFSHVVNLNLLKISGDVELEKSTLNMALGRYFVSDNSAVVFNQPCDGFLFKFAKPTVVSSVYLGYTGLLNALDVSMLAPKRDETNATVTYTTPENATIYSLAHGFMPIVASVEFPTAFGNQTVGLQFMDFFDLQEAEGVERTNRIYGNFTLRGPIAGSVYYNAITVLETYDFRQLMNYSKIQILGYPSRLISFRAAVEYASGQNGFLSTFTGFTSSTAYNSLNSPEYGGMLLPSVNVVLAGKSFYFDIGAKVDFEIPESSITLNGVEADFNSIVNILSDLQFGLNITAFLDINNNDSNAQSNYTATANLKILF